MTHRVVGTPDPATNLANLEAALRDHREIELFGTFELGNEDASRRTLLVERGVKLRGVVETTKRGTRRYRTVIRGGGALLPHVVYGDSHSGAIKVMTDEPVEIEGISFVGCKGPAVLAERCGGLSVIGCRFQDPVPGWMLALAPATPDTKRPEGPNIRFVSAIWAGGPACRGAFLVYGNTYKAGEPAGDDDTIIACGQSSFESIKILANEIHCHDEAIEVLANLRGGAPAASSIVIADNRITIGSLVSDYFGRRGHAAIVCVRNGNSHTTISNNTIRSKGNVAPFLLTGKHFDVFDNTTIQKRGERTAKDARADATFLLGVNVAPLNLSPAALEILGLTDLGPSLDHSAFWHNTLSGSATVAFQLTDYGGAKPNTSHDNRFWDNALDLDYDRALELGAGTHDNRFVGRFRQPHDLAPAGRNTITNDAS